MPVGSAQARTSGRTWRGGWARRRRRGRAWRRRSTGSRSPQASFMAGSLVFLSGPPAAKRKSRPPLVAGGELGEQPAEIDVAVGAEDGSRRRSLVRVVVERQITLPSAVVPVGQVGRWRWPSGRAGSRSASSGWSGSAGRAARRAVLDGRRAMAPSAQPQGSVMQHVKPGSRRTDVEVGVEVVGHRGRVDDLVDVERRVPEARRVGHVLVDVDLRCRRRPGWRRSSRCRGRSRRRPGRC